MNLKGNRMKDQGMTLFEMLVVIILTGVLLAFAVPRFKDMFARMQAWRVTSEIAQMANQARLAAVERGYPVGLCGSADAERCDGRWVDGLLLFVDSNRNRDKDIGEEILHFSPLNASPAVLAWQGFGGNDAVLVEAMGTPYAGNGSFTYCSADAEPAYRRQVIINRGGRVRLSRDDNGDGVHESTSGGVINCP